MTTPACAIDDHGATAAMFTSIHPQDHTSAARICAGCPMRKVCSPRFWGAERPVGTWGGIFYGDNSKPRTSIRADGICQLPGCGAIVKQKTHGPEARYCHTKHRDRAYQITRNDKERVERRANKETTNG